VFCYPCFGYVASLSRGIWLAVGCAGGACAFKDRVDIPLNHTTNTPNSLISRMICLPRETKEHFKMETNK
jgi:hypothetical protein